MGVRDHTVSLLVCSFMMMVPAFSLQRSSDKESILTILQVLGDLLSVGEWEEVGGLWLWCLLDSVWFAGGGAPGHVFCQR